jgi:hypothetical protein
MKLVGYIGMGLALTLVSASALAFQEQGGAPAAPAPTEAQPAAPAAPAGQDLNFATPKSADTGTEVRIPGLGKLGVLPKMDFGLELLYGANEAKQQPEAQQPTEDLTIRGSLKHNF